MDKILKVGNSHLLSIASDILNITTYTELNQLIEQNLNVSDFVFSSKNMNNDVKENLAKQLEEYQDKKDIIIDYLKERNENRNKNNVAKLTSLFQTLTTDEKLSVHMLVFSRLHMGNFIDPEFKKDALTTDNFMEFKSVFDKTDRADLYTFNSEVIEKTNLSKEFENDTIRKAQEESNIKKEKELKIDTFLTMFDNLSFSEKARVYRSGFLGQAAPVHPISPEIDYMIKELHSAPLDLRTAFAEKAARLSLKAMINDTKLAPKEIEEMDKIIEHTAGLRTTSYKQLFVYQILANPEKKHLSNPLINKIIVQYRNLNEIQKSLLAGRIKEKADLINLTKNFESFKNFDFSPLEKIKLKLILNKKISENNFVALSELFEDKGIKKHFKEYFLSDIVVASGNAELVNFMVNKSWFYNKGKTLDRMLQVAEIQGNKDIIDIIAKKINVNFEEKTDFTLPDKNKILTKMNKISTKENKNENGFKIK